MEKEELIHLHMLLAQIKKYCEDKGLNCDFSEYNNSGITPFQVHRSKEEHKQAIFLLGTALASMAAKKTATTNKTQKDPKTSSRISTQDSISIDP
jgi:hypothetical protein